VPGCVATGAVKDTENEIREAIRFHIKGLREDGLPVPQPSAAMAHVDA
jgi:predicted RNase H-like HicB family nuclease